MGLFSRLRRTSAPQKFVSNDPFDLQTPLLYFSQNDPWRIGDACEGLQIFGGTGSGKTSGSGQAVARAFLNHGFGGLVLTAKKDERREWERYMHEAGRSEQLLIFSPSGEWRFDFLNYEMSRPGVGAGQTENLVNLFSSVMEIAERKQQYGGGDSYWQRAMKQLLRNAIDLLAVAKGKVSLPDLYDLVSSAPQSIAESNNEDWQKRSFCFQAILEGDHKAVEPMRKRDFEMAARYWLSEFPKLAEKTRSIIVNTFTTMADGFLRGTLRELFCTSMNFAPEMSLEGAVILLDLPVKEYGELGQLSQVLFKYIWQQAIERRDTSANHRPVFLWADESQNFITSYDREFQSTARSSRACTVYLTQNLPNYYAELGGEKSRSEADAFLGNLQTKIFHANGDHTTNKWASELFAQSWQLRGNMNTGFSETGGATGGQGASESLEYDVLPQEFSTLRKGGHVNGLCVDAIIFQGGRVWNRTGKTFIKSTFTQE